MKYKIVPSILSADFSCLIDDIKKLELNNIEFVHIDVMDGHFVPNLTIGPIVIKAIIPKTQLIFDTHLMISNPEKYIKNFADAGSDSITVHLESIENLSEVIFLIKKYNKKVGISIKPDTSVDLLLEYINDIDLVLIMTVYPGFAGQEFIEDSLDKIRAINYFIKKNKLKTMIEVDGGINKKNYRKVLEAGADILAMGKALFKNRSLKKFIKEIKS